MTKNRWITGIALLVFVGLAVVFGIWDLPISNALYRPESGFAQFMEVYALLPEPALMSFAGMLVCVGVLRCGVSGYRRLKFAFGLACILGSFGYLFYEYGVGQVLLTQFCIMAAADAVVLFAALRVKRDTLWQLCRIAVVTAVFILISLVAVTALKTLWGRVRFRELTDPAEFSRWFLPQGNNGHHSFPSGHTSNAATLWVLTLFAPLLAKPWQKALCYAVPSVWILTMAVGRIMAGAHYASDTLFATAITITLFYVVRRIVYSRFPKEAVNKGLI